MTATRSLEEILERTGCYARAETGAEERKAFDIAQNMITLGYPVEAVVSVTGIDPKKIKKLYH